MTNRDELVAVVEQFYGLLSDPSAADADARTARFMNDDWVSTPTPLGGPGREGFVRTLAAFGELVPDLRWNVRKMIVDGGRVVVVSVATGTPTGPFLGVEEPGGRRFEILTLDIHTIENGLMTRSFHVEDWARAIQQLSGAEVPPLDLSSTDFPLGETDREAQIETTRGFYALLSDAGTPDADARSALFMDDDWVSTPTPLGGGGRSGFVSTLSAFGELVPDLEWHVEEMLVEGSFVAVRSSARGTPRGPFLGVEDPGGRRFDVMTIDLHAVVDGKMVRSFHVEDWAAAINQLQGD
ncbi:MAG: ester cyclase [Sandaracinus sp.]|nr:ester cyclase [Sandaracinus sp.]